MLSYCNPADVSTAGKGFSPLPSPPQPCPLPKQLLTLPRLPPFPASAPSHGHAQTPTQAVLTSPKDAFIVTMFEAFFTAGDAYDSVNITTFKSRFLAPFFNKTPRQVRAIPGSARAL